MKRCTIRIQVGLNAILMNGGERGRAPVAITILLLESSADPTIRMQVVIHHSVLQPAIVFPAPNTPETILAAGCTS